MKFVEIDNYIEDEIHGIYPVIVNGNESVINDRNEIIIPFEYATLIFKPSIYPWFKVHIKAKGTGFSQSQLIRIIYQELLKKHRYILNATQNLYSLYVLGLCVSIINGEINIKVVMK